MAVVITFKDGTTLALDASLRQNHEQRNEVTEHPIETGAEVSDNIRAKPRTFTLEGVVSATPVVNPGETPEANRHVAAYHKLESAAAGRQMIAVATGLKKYPTLAIEGLSVPREPGKGVDLYFTLTLKEVVFATTATATVPKNALGDVKTQRRVPARKHRGVRQGSAPTAAQSKATDKAAANAAAKPKPRYQSWFLQGATALFGH
jgi:hypothetical protein